MATKRNDQEKKRQDEDHRPIETPWGESDADTSSGVPLSGRAGKENQEEAEGFFEEIGGVVEGKEPDEMHEPTMEDEEEEE